MKIALVLVCCTACSLGGSAPNYHYYVLGARPPAAPAPPVPARKTLAIDDVTIPGYLDREQIATRTAGQRLVYSSSDRWAEPLDNAFERTLRDDLTPRLAARGIQVQARGGSPTYDLSVEVMRFERTGPDHVQLSARWTVRVGSDVVATGESHITQPAHGPSTNATASALSDAVAQMATQIADRMQSPHVVAAGDRHRR